MSQHFADLYSPRHSSVHQLDARYKLVSLMVLILVIVRLQNPAALIAALCTITSLLLVARVSPAYIAARLLLAVPFIGFLLLVPFATPGDVQWRLGFLAATSQGLSRALVLGLRIVTALLTITLLSATTRAEDLIQALGQLHVPGLFISVARFSLRYFGLLTEEVARMRRAQKARGFVPGSILQRSTLVPLSRLVGMAFIRALERGERVHLAMKARNYRGATGVRTTGRAIAARGDRVGIGEAVWVSTVCVVIALLLALEGWVTV